MSKKREPQSAAALIRARQAMHGPSQEKADRPKPTATAGRPSVRPENYRRVSVTLTHELWAALGSLLASMSLAHGGDYADKSEALRALVAKWERGEVELTPEDIRAVRW